MNRPACVDYNRCTYDTCTPDPANPDAAVCTYPPRQCVSCDTGTCYNGVCVAEGCSVALGSATVCPGGSVTLNVSGDCWPSCGAMYYAPAGPPPPGEDPAGQHDQKALKRRPGHHRRNPLYKVQVSRYQIHDESLCSTRCVLTTNASTRRLLLVYPGPS
ncbi:MAG: hypothetical protein HY763_09720 [Planctomycetes bacterium]|nr:hypothetical protein [Planctomycetota bacterium]